MTHNLTASARASHSDRLSGALCRTRQQAANQTMSNKNSLTELRFGKRKASAYEIQHHLLCERLQTLTSFHREFPNDEVCLARLLKVRFGTGSNCARCRRPTIWHRIKAERAYSCQWCGNHLHPTAGTPLQNSRIALRLWFYAVRHAEHVGPKELANRLMAGFGTTRESAKRVVQRVSNPSADWTEIALAARQSKADHLPFPVAERR